MAATSLERKSGHYFHNARIARTYGCQSAGPSPDREEHTEERAKRRSRGDSGQGRYGGAVPATSAKTSASSGPDGRGAVRAALDAVPAEQRRLAKRLDKLILAAIPGAVSGVKYRKPSQPLGVPFYGLAETGWLLHLNPLKGRVRLTFFAGSGLKPSPPIAAPGGSRAIDIPSESELDEKQLRAWLQQAKKLPGWGHV